MAGDVIAFLEDWYQRHCDGEWEHDEGIRLTTLDNPGWLLTVHLMGTELEGRVLEALLINRSEKNWVHVSSDGIRFQAAGGALNLGEVLESFREFASGSVTNV